MINLSAEYFEINFIKGLDIRVFFLTFVLLIPSIKQIDRPKIYTVHLIAQHLLYFTYSFSDKAISCN